MPEKETRLEQRARDRLEAVCRVERGELRQQEAARLLGVRAPAPADIEALPKRGPWRRDFA